MIRDITIGQYYSKDSVIHRLDARVKFIATLLFIVVLFVFQSIPTYLLISLMLAGIIAASGVPVRHVLKGLKSIVILVIITVLFNLFLTPGTVALQIWKLKITWEGIRLAAFLAVRLMYLIIGSSFLTFTTTPNQLTDGMESLMKPLKVIHVPVHEIAMMMSIALRFIPILLEETDKIMKAQSARCADFESGNIVRRAKSMIPLLVPLFVSAFRRADDLAMAMEARCYRGGKGRTKMKQLKYRRRDLIAFLVMIVSVVLLCFVNKWF